MRSIPPLPTRPLLVVQLLLVALSSSVEAFAVQTTTTATSFSRTRTTARRTSSHLYQSVELVFNGDCKLISDPLPSDVTKEELLEFFEKKETRDYFFSAGGTRDIDELEMTPEFKQMWHDECQNLADDGSSSASLLLPNNDDSVIGVEAKINFPGLVLTSTTVSGVKKLFFDENNNNGNDDEAASSSFLFPEYQVLGIAEQQRVEGPAPVVWLYSQLTGLNKKQKDKFYAPSAAARSTISIVENNKMNDDSSSSYYAISFDVKLKVVTSVPSVLVKILPASKEKMEEQGGAAVSKTVVKDMEASINHVCEKFLEGRNVVVSSS